MCANLKDCEVGVYVNYKDCRTDSENRGYQPDSYSKALPSKARKACAVCDTIVSTGGKFCPVSIVTRSSSSRPFLCALETVNEGATLVCNRSHYLRNERTAVSV